jgi:hypothetical protein
VTAADQRVERVAGLLREAAQAHHRAFVATDGEDPEWPAWYADYLQAPLGQALGVALARSEIAKVLVEADRAYREQAAPEDWPLFYARAFLRRYRPSPSG